MEKDEAKRAEFMEIVDNLPSNRLYYIDECGLDKYLHREYGYAPRGAPIYGKVSGKKFKRVNVIAAQCEGRIVAPMTYKGTTDSVVFEWWFVNVLLKTAPKDSVFILDNASFHRKRKLRELAARAGCEVLFLPSYSPDLNPIENFWAWLKQRLRSILPLFSSFDDALLVCFHVK